MNFFPILLLALGGIVLTAGDIVMKKWIVTSSAPTFFIGLAIWMIGLLFLAQSFKYKNIAIASTIFVIFNVVTLSLVSWFYFKEKLTPIEFFGIFLGILSIIILESSEK